MYLKFTTGIALVLITLTAIPTYAQPAEYIAPKVLAVKKTPEPAKTIPQLVEMYALKYNVSSTQMMATIKCESGFNPKAVGDHGTSYGLSQIHLPAHPNITVAQATTPEFAVEFMAKEFARGNQKIWTCYRILYT